MTMAHHKTAKAVPELSVVHIDRFLSRIDRSDPDGCWLWTGAVTSRGYGAIRVGDRMVTVHRVAYKLMHGQVPDHRVIDHAGPDGMGCISQLCVRGDHLEAVGQDLNTARQYLRGERPSYLTPEERAYYETTPDEVILAEAMGRYDEAPAM